MRSYIEVGRLHIGLLPQWARWMRTSCCHYTVWIQWGPFEIAVERKNL
jgi:hypothetical protein